MWTQAFVFFFGGAGQILSFFNYKFLLSVNLTNFANFWRKNSNFSFLSQNWEKKKRKKKKPGTKILFLGWGSWPCGDIVFFFKFVGLAYQGKEDIVFRFIIEYSSLRDFYGPLGNNNKRSIFIWGFLKDDIFGLCLKLEISYNRVLISWRILVSFRGFFLEDYIFCMVKYLSFHNSSFALR